MKIAAIMMNLGIPIPQSIPKVNCFSVAPIESATPERFSSYFNHSQYHQTPEIHPVWVATENCIVCHFLITIRIDRRMGKLEPKLGQRSASINRSIRLRLRLKDRNLLEVP